MQKSFIMLYMASRDPFWNYLISLRSKINHPWLLVGDFNEVLLPYEIIGGNFYNARAKKFAKMIDNGDLLDLGFKGHPFTW